MKLSYVLKVDIDVATEGGRALRESLGDDVGDALRDAVLEIFVEGETAHATKDGETVEFTGEVTAVEFGSD